MVRRNALVSVFKLKRSFVLDIQVKYEAAAAVGDKPADNAALEAVQCPHLYGGINKDAVLKIATVSRDANSGKYLAIPDLQVCSN